MSDVRTVYTTAEVAEMLQITSSYLLRLAAAMRFEIRRGRGARERDCAVPFL